MATNVYVSHKVKSEQNLYEDIIIESLKFYGQDVYYLPRTLVNEDKILGEDIPSKYSSAYKIEMYIENVEGFDGEGDLFTKFGVEIRDQATFIVARRRWRHVINQQNNVIDIERPREGDVIYLPLSKSMFQIMAVEHEQPFYQISNLPTYKLRCETFEYNGEDFDAGIETIDAIDADYAYEYQLTLDSAGSNVGYRVGEQVTQTFSDGVIMSGEVSNWNDSDLVLSIIHAGADDGKYHTFVTGLDIVGVNNTINVNAVNEDNQLSSNEKNGFFDTTDAGMSFLDFSEGNPFGDPQ